MGGGEVQKKYSHKGKLNEKNSWTPTNPKKYSCYSLKKIHTRNLITKKNSCGSKIPHPLPSIIFLMVRPLVDLAHWLSPYHCHAPSNSLNTANSLSSGTRYFRFPPNLAHRKLIDLAKYVLSSSSRGVLSLTQRFFKRRRHSEFICRGFCEEWKLVSTNFNQILQIQVKQIILKDSRG